MHVLCSRLTVVLSRQASKQFLDHLILIMSAFVADIFIDYLICIAAGILQIAGD